MCPENEWEDSRLGLLSGSMCKKRTQCATSCCGQGVGKVLAQVFTRKKILVHQRVLKKSGLSQTESDETTPLSKILFLNARCMATWRAATTAQGQFVAARTCIAGAVGGWRCVGDVLLSWLPLAGWQARRVLPEHPSFLQVSVCGVGLRPNNGLQSSVFCNPSCLWPKNSVECTSCMQYLLSWKLPTLSCVHHTHHIKSQ